jgi:hypothetical protein
VLQSQEEKRPMEPNQLECNQQWQHLSMSIQQLKDYKTKNQKDMSLLLSWMRHEISHLSQYSQKNLKPINQSVMIHVRYMSVGCSKWVHINISTKLEIKIRGRWHAFEFDLGFVASPCIFCFRNLNP